MERGRYFQRRRVCRFCHDKIAIDYKDVGLIRNFLTEWGRIIPRRMSGNCLGHQRELTIAIKRARTIALVAFAERVAGVNLLRVYWYDGTSTGPTAQHLTLAHLDNVKVRLGFVNSVGEQKGVDSLIVTDMITLARNRAISDAVLVSGDEDLQIGRAHV